MPTVFFDLDGTLHETMRIYGPAFRAGLARLAELGFDAPQEVSDEEVSRYLGYTVQDMWTTFMPDLPEEVWMPISLYVGEKMDELTAKGKAALFEGTYDVLKFLHESGYTLVLLSNCGRGYMETHLQAHGIQPFFDGGLCSGDYPGLEKWEMYQSEKDRFPLPHAMVGDRFHDLEVATKSGILGIGCAYGYGKPEELSEADVVIQDITELPSVLETRL